MNDNPQEASLGAFLPKMMSDETRATMERMIQQGREFQQQQLHLLRGPILIGVAILSILLSIAQSLSLGTMLQLSVLGLGLALLSYDASEIGNDQLRIFVKGQLDSIVWDDIMYQFWHPNIEWWRIFVENFIGQASWMYILPSTSTQRVQLVQAALQIEEQEAQRILFAPGGYKNLLLPTSLIKWLENDKDQGTNDNNNSLQVQVEQVLQPKRIVDTRPPLEEELVGTSSSSASESSSPPSSPPLEKDSLSESAVLVDPHQDALVTTTTTTATAATTTTATADKGAKQKKRPGTQQPQQPLPSLSDTMKCIIQDAISDQLRELLTFAPDSKQLAGIGITAAAALTLQLRYSPRARRIALGVLETSAMAGLSTVTLGASGLFLAKVLNGGKINESNLIAYISNVLRLRKNLSGTKTTTTTTKSTGVVNNNGSNGNSGDNFRKGALCAAVAIALLGLRKRHFPTTNRQQQQQRPQPIHR